jgi:hypothetical protein
VLVVREGRGTGGQVAAEPDRVVEYDGQEAIVDLS